MFAVLIDAFSPGINDTTINLVLVKGENATQADYLEQVASIELVKNVNDIKNRVEKRNTLIGIIPEDEGYYLMTQGMSLKALLTTQNP